MKRTLALALLTGMIVLSTASLVQAACRDRTLNRSYAFTAEGTRIGGTDPGPRAGIARIVFDGKGGLTLTSETKSAAGVIVQGITGTGTYVVNADCTGSFTVNLTNPDTSTEVRHVDFVIADTAKTIYAVQTDVGRAVDFVGKRQ